MQQGENGEEPAQRVSHVSLHHLPPNAQEDESHQAECLQTECSASLDTTWKPGHFVFLNGQSKIQKYFKVQEFTTKNFLVLELLKYHIIPIGVFKIVTKLL